MPKKRILLPNPMSYIDHINEILVDSFTRDTPPVSQAQATTSVAKLLVKEEGFIVVDTEDLNE